MKPLSATRAADVSRTAGLDDLGWVLGVPRVASPAQLAAASRLESPLVPDRELLPTWETAAAGILDAYQSLRRP